MKDFRGVKNGIGNGIGSAERIGLPFIPLKITVKKSLKRIISGPKSTPDG
jgi:hypothetical protein